ncbi:MAG: hypothetical protein P8Y78_09320 [Acidihalobacter sp.]|jgi:plastocyanin
MHRTKTVGITKDRNRTHNVKRLAAGLLLGCTGVLLTTHAAFAASPQNMNGQVKFEGTGFNVMNVQLVLGTGLQFANPSNNALDVRIVTWRGKVVKNLSVPAHGRATWTPAHYGVYDYFDARNTDFGSVTIDGSDGEKVYQPVARKQSKAFPAPAYGVVAVTNASGGGIPLSSSYGAMEVPGASTLTGKHHRAFMNKAPWMEVPGGTMTFKPWVLTVKAGQAVQIYNEDGMKHGFFPGAYSVMYDDRGRIKTYHHNFQGFDLHKNGGHRSITFKRPGIYHILCPIHSYAWDHTYKSHHFYGGYPYVMDAVVVVEPNVKA